MSTRKEFRQVERRLRIWGDWLVEFYDQNGYPKQTSFLNPEFCKDSCFEGSRIIVRENPLALEIDAIMNFMRPRHPEWHEVIKNEYTVHISRSEKFKKLKLTRNRYMFLLDLGKSWVEARLA